ncbi:MAG: glycosyltransferase family 2 protein [Bacteroidia bacterium]|nr:glycosyltransferase family 2 protein [Bacteroidales bacterium]NCD43199.1 glycosyltransferase family 2 protein [Bacteroidia bacterium]HPE85992.1 glycosyltransferase family 2 protein [Bacteroidales bacterium]
MMDELSVVIITHNEEKNIARCLDSIRALAGEIIVVDSHSNDATADLCRESGAKVITHDFQGYGKQKQFANSLATRPWILSLDADETLTLELHDSIKNAIAHPVADAYSMNRLTRFCNQWIHHGGWYPDKKIRLFKKEAANWNDFPVHEELIVKKGRLTEHLKGDLLHYSIPSIDQHMERINRYSTIAAEKIAASGKKITLYHLLIKPLARFIKIYVLKAGFLDGFFGYIIARNSAFAIYLRYSKAKAITKTTIR